MINQVYLMGRLTKEVEVRYSQGGDTAIGRFNMAVDRDYQKQGEERQTDFISCVAFGKTAEFISKYFGKGNLIAVIGRIQTGSYTNQEGKTIYTTDVVVEKASFTGEKRDDNAAASNSQPQEDKDGFVNVEDSINSELPFS